MSNAAVKAAGPRMEKFLVPMGRYLGYMVLVAGLVLIGLGVEGEGTGSLGLDGVTVACLLVAWVVLVRPEVTAHRNGLLMRNMLRDTFLPWSSIKTCRVAQTLQVSTRDHVYHGLGISKSARQASRENRQIRRQSPIGPNLGMSRLQFAPKTDVDEKSSGDDRTEVNVAMQEHVVKSNFRHTEERIEYYIRERSKATADQSPKVAWDPVPIIALAVAAAGVMLAFFV